MQLSARICRVCESEKSDEDFYWSSRYKCKECIKQSVRENRAANADRYKAYDRQRANRPDRVAARLAYQQTEAFRQSHVTATRKWDANNPQRRRAQWAVSNAVRDGKLQKLPCFCCGEQEVEGHHPDYSRPLDVVWLCVRHHNELHAEHEARLRGDLLTP